MQIGIDILQKLYPN